MPVIDLGRVIGPQGPQGETGAQGIRGEQGLPGPNQVTNSTATPLTGVLTGNGSVVGVETIDAAPTPDSTGFATSGGTDKAIKGRVPVYGLGKNLLDNWYFLDPVNQRGASSYTANGYCIDRWYLKWAQSLEMTSTGIKFTAQSDSVTQIVQEVGTGKVDEFQGKDVVFSVLVSSITGTGRISIMKGTSISDNTTTLTATDITGAGVYSISWRVDATAGSRLNWIIQASEGAVMTVAAAKLELGTEQTLCHNEGTDANPVWVLNEVPDYEYELYRCITSTADSTDTYANKSLATEQQLAYVETGTTASRAYAVGEYFCWNGLLYRCTLAIASGGTFAPGTNCEQVTGGGLNDTTVIDLSSSVSRNTTNLSSINCTLKVQKKRAELTAELTPNTLASLHNKVLAYVPTLGLPTTAIPINALWVENYSSETSQTKSIYLVLDTHGNLRSPNQGGYDGTASTTSSRIYFSCSYFTS